METALEALTEAERAEAELMKCFRKDWIFFIEYALGHKTWSKQREIINAVKDNQYVAVRSNHGASKTFTAAELAVTVAELYPNSKVITTAPTNDQVERLLWKEINNIYQNSRIELSGICQQKDIKFPDNPNHFAYGFSTDKPARAEGWHAPILLFILDEAKGVLPWVWDSFKGLMAGYMTRFLAISTTDGVAVGEPYWKCFKDNNSKFKKIHISAFESPNVTGEKWQYIDIPDLSKPFEFERKYQDPKTAMIPIANNEWIKDRIDEWGRDSILVQTKVDGEIVDIGEDTIIKLSQFQKMIENSLNEDFDGSGQLAVGVDVARGGTDDTVFIKKRGLQTEEIKVIQSAQLPEKDKTGYICDELSTFMGHDYKTIIRVDDTGVGGGVTDGMQRKRYNVTPVNFGGNAKDKDHYGNTISEMWFTLAQKIQDIALPKKMDSKLRDRLQAELINRKYSIDKKGRRIVESKKDYKKRLKTNSPDLADAFLLAFYDKAVKTFVFIQ